MLQIQHLNNWTEKVIHFYAFGKEFSLFVNDLGAKMRLYKSKDTTTDEFRARLDNVDSVNVKEFWAKLTHGREPYAGNKSKVTALAEPEYKVLHHMLARLITGQLSSPTVVNHLDLLCLYSMVRGVKIHMGMVIACMLQAHAPFKTSAIFIGPYLSCLLRGLSPGPQLDAERVFATMQSLNFRRGRARRPAPGPPPEAPGGALDQFRQDMFSRLDALQLTLMQRVDAMEANLTQRLLLPLLLLIYRCFADGGIELRLYWIGGMSFGSFYGVCGWTGVSNGQISSEIYNYCIFWFPEEYAAAQLQALVYDREQKYALEPEPVMITVQHPFGDRLTKTTALLERIDNMVLSRESIMEWSTDQVGEQVAQDILRKLFYVCALCLATYLQVTCLDPDSSGPYPVNSVSGIPTDPIGRSQAFGPSLGSVLQMLILPISWLFQPVGLEPFLDNSIFSIMRLFLPNGLLTSIRSF
nr:mediator of RNA polymerase II transcription subunit 12-like [Ipomoea batatas]